jgi:2-C-methyl-D-erythritol 4-phosphate cytidylyltransferase
VAVIIPAGGKGTRLGTALPKQFLPLAGIPILRRTVEVFQSYRGVHEIVVVVPSDQISRTRKLLPSSEFGKLTGIVAGGSHRQESVWNGMQALAVPPDIVLVHDAVRPMVDRKVITEVIHEAAVYRAAVVGVRVKDTIKVEEHTGFYSRTLPRHTLWAVQTPQGFRADVLQNAHRAARHAGFLGTDEASLVERLGIPVRIVEGIEKNLKITTKEDLQLAEFLLRKG